VTSTHSRTASLGLAALALVAAGCGSSGSSASSSPGTSTSTSPSGSPTGPSYRPAGGPQVKLRSFTARAPARWKLDRSFGRAIVFANDPHFRDEITFSDSSIYPGTSLSRAERIVGRDDTWRRTPESLPRVMIAGETFFHLAGPAAAGSWYEVYGHVSGARVLELAFETDEPKPVRERLIGSVLATVRLP
jgi:hypothetical protein